MEIVYRKLFLFAKCPKVVEGDAAAPPDASKLVEIVVLFWQDVLIFFDYHLERQQKRKWLVNCF